LKSKCLLLRQEVRTLRSRRCQRYNVGFGKKKIFSHRRGVGKKEKLKENPREPRILGT
jgi:hypothetical protein